MFCFMLPLVLAITLNNKKKVGLTVIISQIIEQLHTNVIGTEDSEELTRKIRRACELCTTD